MEPTQEFVDLGKKCFENRDYPNAERYLRKVLESNNRFADIHNLLGVVCHLEGKFESAIASFEEALKINPNYTEALLNLAVLYNDLGRFAEAKKLYTRLKKKTDGKIKDIEPVLKGKLSNMHAQLGDTYRSIGLYAQAAEEYRKALILNPSYADIRTKLGVALREAGDLNGAEKELKRVLQEKPGYLLARIQLGINHYAKGKAKEAQKEWQTVLKKDPNNESAKTYLKLCGK